MGEETANVLHLGFITWYGTPQEFLTTLISVGVLAVVCIVGVKSLIAIIGALWRAAFVYCGVPFAMYNLGASAVSEEYKYLPLLLCIVYIVIVLVANPFNAHERRHSRRYYEDDDGPPRHRRNSRRGTAA